MNSKPEKTIHEIIPPQATPPYGWYPPPTYYVEEEVNLLDYFRALRKNWGKIALLTFLITALGLAACFYFPKKYKAEVSLMPLSQSGGGGLATLASQMSNLPLVGGQLSGLAGLTGGTQKSGQIVSILKSRTLLEQVVREFDLTHVIFKDRWDPAKQSWKPSLLGSATTPEMVMEDTVKKMRKKILSVQDDKKTGLIKVNVELKDPILASKVANSLVVLLQDFIQHNQLTVAKRNRVFIEEQLQKNKVDFLEFGKRLNQFYSNNRVSSVIPQMEVNIGKVESPPKSFEEFRTELGDLQQKKEETADKLAEAEQTGIVHNVPSQVYLQYLTLQRELLGRVNALLTQQYELAKIEEAKEDLTFQVIDKAVPPARPSWPQKPLIVSVAFVSGLFLSVFLAFFLEYIRKMQKANPAS